MKFSILGEAFNLLNFANIYTVQTTEYNLSGTNMIQNIGPTGFLTPTATNNNLSGARQLQIAARLAF